MAQDSRLSGVRQQALRRVCRRCDDFKYLAPRSLAAFKADRRLCQPQPIGNKRDQRGIGFAIHRRCGQAYFQCIAMDSGDFRFICARLDVQRQPRTPVTFT